MNIFITEKYYYYCSIINLEDYLCKNKDYINWNIMSAHPRLTDELAEEYKDYINFNTYNKYKEIFKELRNFYKEASEQFIQEEAKHDRVYIKSISIIHRFHKEEYQKQKRYIINDGAIPKESPKALPNNNKRKDIKSTRNVIRYVRHDDTRSSFSYMRHSLPSQIMCEYEDSVLQALNCEYDYSEDFDYNYYDFNHRAN